MSNNRLITKSDILLNQKKVYQFEDVQTEPGRTIIIKPIHNNDKNGNRFRKLMKNYHDIETGATCGFVVGIDPNSGDYLYRKNWIIDRGMFNLGNLPEAKLFAFWKNSPLMEGSVNQMGTSTTAILMIHDEVVEQDKTMQKEKEINSLKSIIFNWTDEEKQKFGWLYSIDSRKSTVVEITNMLLNHAQTNPYKLRDIVSNQKRSNSIIILNMGISAGVIDVLASGAIQYQGTLIGNTKQMAEEYLIDNPAVMATIYGSAKQILQSTDILVNIDVTAALPAPHVHNASNAELLERMAKLEAIINGNKAMLDPGPTEGTVIKNVAGSAEVVPLAAAPEPKGNSKSGQKVKASDLRKPKTVPVFDDAPKKVSLTNLGDMGDADGSLFDS